MIVMITISIIIIIITTILTNHMFLFMGISLIMDSLVRLISNKAPTWRPWRPWRRDAKLSRMAVGGLIPW